MVDNFSTTFENWSKFSPPFFLPLTIAIRRKGISFFHGEKRKQRKSWHLENRLVLSRDRFRIAYNIGGEGRGELRSPVWPLNIKCILFMQRCAFDNIPNGTLLWLHSITQRIPSNPSARNRTAKKLHRCSSVFPIFERRMKLSPHYLPYTTYVYIYFPRLFDSIDFSLCFSSSFLFFFVLTDKLGPRQSSNNKNSTRNTHTRANFTIKQEYFRNSGYYDRIIRRHFSNPLNSYRFFERLIESR